MDLHEETEAGATIATPGLEGVLRLDSFNAGAFELALRKLIGETTDMLILDLQAVSYISSAGIRVVMIAAKELRSREREFRLCSLTRPVQGVFATSGMGMIVRICADRADALQSVER